MFGVPPVVLIATREVVVEVRSPFVVTLSWPGEPFVAQSDGSYVSTGAASGCHRLDLDVRDPASDVVGLFGVNIAVQSAC